MIDRIIGAFKGTSAPAWASLAGVVVMAVLTTLSALGGGHTPTRVEVVQVAIAAVGAFNVWAAANLPQYAHIKRVVSIVTLVLQAVVMALMGGMAQTEWFNVGVALLTTLGVMTVPHPLTTVADLPTGAVTKVQPASE